MKKFYTLVISLFVALGAMAQVTTSSMNGFVTDSKGEPVIGATIVAVHTPSGTEYAVATNVSGRFNINGMRTGGPYTVEVSFIGMSTMKYEDIYLKLGEPGEVNATLSEGTEIETISIVGQNAFVASKTGAADNFSLEAVEAMPTINRSVYDIVKLTPQASVNKNGGMSFAGSNNRYNSFQIDGAMANDTFGLSSDGTNGAQAGANPVSLDAIEEIQVVVAPFDVRQSGFTGGAINAITKSGTNKIKGSFSAYYNNQDFIGMTHPANAKTDKEGNLIRTKYDEQYSQTYSFTVGGPIIKNKLFLFVSGEYFGKSRPNIYSPANGVYTNALNVVDRDDNKKTQEGILYKGQDLGYVLNETVAQAMIDHYKENYANGVEGFEESYGLHQITDRALNFMARLDWNINENNKLMFRYQLADAYADKYDANAGSYKFYNSSYKMANNTNSFVVELNSRISDNISNEFRATAVLVRDHRDVPYKGANIYIDNDTYTVSLGTEYSSGANGMNSDNYTISDNLSIFLGDHNITIGTHNEIFKFSNIFLQGAYGSYYFKTVEDYLNNKSYKYAYRYADPAYTNGEPVWAATTLAAQFGLYAQDEWKPNRDFTLTYGVRADLPLLLNNPTENTTFNETEIAKNNNEYVGTVPKAQILWSPRVGFRYWADEDHTLLLRGGAGLFTGRVPFVWLSNVYNNTGVEAKGVTAVFDEKNPFNGFPLTSNPYEDIIEAGKLSAGGKQTINTINENFKYPQVFRANLGIDKYFEGGWQFTVDALFSKTLNNVFFKNLAIESNNVVYAVNSDVEATAPYYTINKDYDAIVALSNTNKGYTYSISGQVKKSFEFGLDLMAAYTYGHSYSVNDGTSSVAYSNWKYNYSVDTNSDELSYSLFDRPHKFSAMVSYTTPVYKNMQTSIALSYEGQSGQRFCYTMNETPNNGFNGDGQKGNSLMYIPTTDEISLMNWANSGADAVLFEQYIRNDKYLSAHRGQWSERYGGIAPFEHHFDLHVSQDFFYDKTNGRKVQLTFDVLNVGNLLNPNWGINYSSAYNLQILEVTALTPDADGNMTPTYAFNPKQLYVNDFYSRWRAQLGLRVTF